MKKHLRTTTFFLLAAAILTVIAGVLRWNDPLYALSQPHPGWLNVLAVNITFMGDAFFAFGLIVYFLLFKQDRKIAGLLFTGTVIGLLTVQATRNIFYGGHLRLYFEKGQLLFNDFEAFATTDLLVFPSSHAAMATVIGLILAANFPKYRFVWCSCIALVVLSRVYLAGDAAYGLLGGLTAGLSAYNFTPLFIRYLRLLMSWNAPRVYGKWRTKPGPAIGQTTVSV